jgi:hypothetical protein
MSLPGKSTQDLYNLFITTLRNECPQLTDLLDGSINDGLGGTSSIAGSELQRYITIAFNKTFFDLAGGPDETGGPDDLQTLAVDHFGDDFSRPVAVAAIDTATFVRPSSSYLLYGAVDIPAGTVVKTDADANGNVNRYTTDSDVTLANSSSGVAVSVGITAVVAGASTGNAAPGTIDNIEDSLTDPTVTVSNAGNATGVDAMDTPTYRAYIRNLLTTLKAAVIAAIEGAALSVPGVATATAIEVETAVIPYNIATGTPVSGADWFYIPRARVYIADSGGGASDALIALVKAAVDGVKAFGVFIEYIGSTPIVIDWTAAITLNPSGPNFAVLSTDTTLIKNSMKNYIANLGPETDFVRDTADANILAQWGPSGSNDLTAFATTIPTGDIAIGDNQDAIPGDIETV